MGDDDLLVGIFNHAFIPFGQGGAGRGGLLQDAGSAAFAKYHAFEQRVAGQAVGSMQTRVAGFAYGVEAWQVGLAVQVGDYAAAGVVRGWHYGYGGGGNVYA